MSVFDGWEDWQEGDFSMADSMSIDLATPEGFSALAIRANADAYHALNDRWDTFVGVGYEQVADWLTEDFAQESVSLPKGAFSDPQTAGRELLIVRRVYRFLVGYALLKIAQDMLHARAFPSGQPTPQHEKPAHRAHK